MSVCRGGGRGAGERGFNWFAVDQPSPLVLPLVLHTLKNQIVPDYDNLAYYFIRPLCEVSAFVSLQTCLDFSFSGRILNNIR